VIRVSELTSRDFRKVLDLIYAINEDPSGTLVAGAVLSEMRRVIGCQTVSYNQVEHATWRLLNTVYASSLLSGEAAETVAPGLQAAVTGHPASGAYRRGRLSPSSAVALSDIVDRRVWRRTRLYTDFYRAWGTEDELLALVSSTRRRATVLSVSRDRVGFSRRDRAITDLLVPHFRQALARRERLAALASAARNAYRQGERVEEAVARMQGLTPRERDVITYLAGGATDREIAHALAVGIRTVHKHLEQIYRKLGLTNRTSVIAAVHRATGTPGDRAVDTSFSGAEGRPR
jgi:DNA-binding CsgD family transcriptional regulator